MHRVPQEAPAKAVHQVLDQQAMIHDPAFWTFICIIVAFFTYIA
jgi:hypothetical protein